MLDLDGLVFNISSFIAGLFLLEYGADKFIDHTAIVAKRLNVSPTLVGLLTCGAEWEELVVIIVALSQNNSSLALGNLIGSSVANILASFSLGLLFMKTATFDRSSKIYAAVLLAATTAFVLLLFTLSAELRWVAGVILMIAFVVYVVSVASLIYRGTLTPPEDDSDDDSDSSNDTDGHGDGGSESESDDTSDGGEDGDRERRPRASTISGVAPRNGGAQGRRLIRLSKARRKDRPSGPSKRRPKPLWHHASRLLLGLAALLVSSYIVAHSANALGTAMGLSGTVIGTTILSLATTLPEKFVAIMGGVRHQPGIMVANTVGSNIFLATLCGGVLFLCGNVDQIKQGFTVFEAMVMWISAALILGMVLAGGRRWMGAVCLCFYVVFLGLEFSTGRRLGDD